MSKVIYPEYMHIISGIQNVSTNGKPRFYICSTSMNNYHLHQHDYVEFTYFVKGRGIQRINGIQHDIKPGSASFVLPRQMHEYQSEDDLTSQKYTCMFDLQFLFGERDDSDLCRLLYGIGSQTPAFIYFQEEDDMRMRRLFGELLEEYERKDAPGNYYMIRAKLTELLLLFIRYGNGRLASEPPSDPKDGWFWQALHYLHVHYAEPLTLEELARRFYVSATHLSRTFKEQTGQSFLEYIHRIRVDSASSMLLHTNMTISEIGLAVGFESFRSFSRVFREVKGITAREFRKNR